LYPVVSSRERGVSNKQETAHVNLKEDEHKWRSSEEQQEEMHESNERGFAA
jgi:hypothetical protein